jgi:hypothetical protein
MKGAGLARAVLGRVPERAMTLVRKAQARAVSSDNGEVTYRQNRSSLQR